MKKEIIEVTEEMRSRILSAEIDYPVRKFNKFIFYFSSAFFGFPGFYAISFGLIEKDSMMIFSGLAFCCFAFLLLHIYWEGLHKIRISREYIADLNKSGEILKTIHWINVKDFKHTEESSITIYGDGHKITVDREMPEFKDVVLSIFIHIADKGKFEIIDKYINTVSKL